MSESKPLNPFKDTAASLIERGRNLQALGKAMSNPRTHVETLAKLAYACGARLSIEFDEVDPPASGAEALRMDVAAFLGEGTPLRDVRTENPIRENNWLDPKAIAGLQVDLREVGVHVELSWLAEQNDADLDSLQQYAFDSVAAIAEGSEPPVRPSVLPQE